MPYESVEFVDCGSIQIQYDATGKATVSFTVVRSDTQSLTGTYNSIAFGNVFFSGSIMSAVQKPIIGGDGWCEWSMQLQGVGE